MARTTRPRTKRSPAGWIARAGAILVLAGSLSVALPAVAAFAPHAALPSPLALGADDSVRLDKPSVPVRIQVPYAGIDLPVVSSERNVRGNSADYPLCDVAEYWTRYDLPGAPGTAWIYAHAQPGMFLPLFTLSRSSSRTAGCCATASPRSGSAPPTRRSQRGRGPASSGSSSIPAPARRAPSPSSRWQPASSTRTKRPSRRRRPNREHARSQSRHRLPRTVRTAGSPRPSRSRRTIPRNSSTR